MSRALIVEADGGARGNPGIAAGGAVVIDGDTGEVLAELGVYVGVATNNVAEYRGMLEGLRRAYQLDPGASVHVRMDSKLVVEQMTGRWRIKHPDMQRLASEARELIGDRPVTFEWIPRAANARADALANRAMDVGSSFGL
jgi:ribonuclease HI